ncbi:MAG: NADH-quinone oxidoreductase subunit B family protein [Promethearchaeia archaeon]
MGILKWAQVSSPWLLHFPSGGCNGCDIELVAALMPRFDLERFGAVLKGSPRHADILVVTGPVTLQNEKRLKRIYEQIPEPKFVIAIGACASSGAPFQGCYSICGGVDKVIPVDAYVPGCPPKPEAIIDGVSKLLAKLKRGDSAEKDETPERIPELKN